MELHPKKLIRRIHDTMYAKQRTILMLPVAQDPSIQLVMALSYSWGLLRGIMLGKVQLQKHEVSTSLLHVSLTVWGQPNLHNTAGVKTLVWYIG